MYGGERHPAGDAHTCERMTQSPPCAAAGHTTFCLSVSELRLALLSFFLFLYAAPGWLQTQGDPPVSASSVPGLQERAIMLDFSS